MPEPADHTLELLRRIDNRLTDLVGEVRANQRSTNAQLGLVRQQLTTMAGYQSVQDESRPRM